MGVRVKGIRDSDGSGVEVDLSDVNLFGSRRLSSFVNYSYSASNDPPPISGQIRTNNDSAIDTTMIFIHRIDGEDRDIKFFLMQVKTGQQFYIQDIDNSDSRALFTLIEDPIDNADYLTLNVECDKSTAVLLEGKGLLIALLI